MDMKKKKSHCTLLVLTFGLAYLLGIVGPFSSLNPIYSLFFLALLSIVFNTSRAVDEILVVCVATLGIVPIFGWVNIPEWANPVQLIIATWFCVIIQNWQRKLEKPLTLLSIAPLTIAPIFGFQWWKDMSAGDPASVLTRILPIWDLSGHFAVFYNNLVDNIYIPRKAPPTQDLTWAFQEYPTGIHYVWAQFAKADKSRILANSEVAIPIFINSVVVTLVLSTLIAGLCIWRLNKALHLRIAISMLCSGVSVALITLGPLSQTVSTGFANIPAVVIAMLVYLSFAVKPHQNHQLQFFVLCCSILCMAYNWYPTLLLIAPSFVFLLAREMRKSKDWKVFVFCLLTSCFAAMPLIQTFALGLSHIEEQGGVQPFPSGLLVTVLITATAVAVWSNSASSSWLYLAITFPAPLLTLALAIWLRLKTDSYPYYFHKASLFVAAYAIFALLFICAVIYESAKSEEVRVPFMQKTKIVLAATLMSFGMSQMFGYWGFDYAAFSGLSSAYGVLNRNEFVRLNDLNRPTALLVIDQAKEIENSSIQNKSCSTLMISSEVGVSDKSTTFGWKGPLENIWFHALSRSLTSEAQQLSYMTASISPVANDSDLFVDSIKKTFHPPSTCVITSKKIKSKIENLPWKSLTELIE